MESKSWFQGPSFLQREVEWPEQPEQCFYLTEDDVEVKTSAAVSCTNSNKCTDPLNQLVEYYSSWHKLKKAAAWILKTWKKEYLPWKIYPEWKLNWLNTVRDQLMRLRYKPCSRQAPV
ncbi:hypothetical protein HF521_002283 [Silurus meridionalis]|uniref:Uncharacterized protein n=1 Tax=Silurus meridionalis TaxID=175797 RepID=A0A8T0B404_SILME|nr:hypothetical protein HF521_002283 [Silurus meridionalis]